MLGSRSPSRPPARGFPPAAGSAPLIAFLFLVSFLVFPAPSLLAGDVIYLKNGRKIVGEVVESDAKRVVYSIQGGELSVPASAVDHIEKSALPAGEQAAGSDAPAERKRELPLPTLPSVGPSPSAESSVVKDGAVDEAYLRSLDDDVVHNPSPANIRLLKRAYQLAALFQASQGDPDGAIQKYRQALKLVPHDLELTVALGYLEVTQNHYLEAMDLLLPAADRYPTSADLRVLLGSAYYGMEDMDEAISQWNKALALQDNPRLHEAIAKAEREREIAGSYRDLRSEHFLLRYEGGESEQLSGEVLNSLETSFSGLVLDLDYAPSEVIVALLYPNQAFSDVTRSPKWAGGINDGKIRVPVSGLTRVNADLARVLKHELTHSFVRQITQGHCPTWFNEGLAQLEEGATTATMGHQLAQALAEGRLPSFQSLEGPFLDMPQEQVLLVYAKSLAGLECLRNTYDMAGIRNLLKAMPAQADFAALLQDQLHLTYPAFEQEVADYLKAKYGH
jgi:tetratricopeptide (TPR) repeat protein